MEGGGRQMLVSFVVCLFKEPNLVSENDYTQFWVWIRVLVYGH